MTRAPVRMNSTLLATVAYDPAASLLELAFCDGTIYQYSAVSELLYRGLMAANSKGTYFNQHIRSRLPYTRLRSSK